jgi:hypothetical protein
MDLTIGKHESIGLRAEEIDENRREMFRSFAAASAGFSRRLVRMRFSGRDRPEQAAGRRSAATRIAITRIYVSERVCASRAPMGN